MAGWLNNRAVCAVGLPLAQVVGEFEFLVDAGHEDHAFECGDIIGFELSVATGDDYGSVGVASVERTDCLTALFVGGVGDRA